MSKIVLVLPGNTFHSNHQSARMEAMDREKGGLSVFRKYGIPATVFSQGVDLRMKPWLREEMAVRDDIIDWGNAPFSHSLIPLYDSWREETREKLGTLPVTFFAEFYVPRPEQMPTEYTLVLAGQSSLYSAFTDARIITGQDILVHSYPEGAHAIRFGGKVGILMREEWYGPLLGAYFRFQRFPLTGSDPDGNDRLAELVAQIRAIADDGQDRVVVTPLDLEAPWVGSHFGAKVWEILFAELRREGLDNVFVSLASCLDRFAREAVPAPRPHRELTKWSIHEVQHRHERAIHALKPRSDKHVLLKMIASGSDIFSAWGSKILEGRKVVKLTAVKPDGTLESIRIGYNQSVIDVQLAAFHAVANKSSMLAELGTIEKPDYFVTMAIEMAKREGW